MTDRHVVTYATTKLLNRATAARILLELGDLLARQDRADLALTGGRDAADVYALMGADPLSQSVDWSRVHLWWSDERFVGLEDPDRNDEQARQAWYGSLIDQGLLPQANVHSMPVDTRSPAQVEAADQEENERALTQAAAAYQQEIIDQLGPEGRMDLAVFGVGPDGHYASLFPDRSEIRLQDDDLLVTGVSNSPKLPPLRVTMTTPFIRRTPKIWLFTSTAEKASAVAAALGTTDDPHVPSSYARGTLETLWLLDADAASKLH